MAGELKSEPVVQISEEDPHILIVIEALEHFKERMKGTSIAFIIKYATDRDKSNKRLPLEIRQAIARGVVSGIFLQNGNRIQHSEIPTTAE